MVEYRTAQAVLEHDVVRWNIVQFCSTCNTSKLALLSPTVARAIRTPVVVIQWFAERHCVMRGEKVLCILESRGRFNHYLCI